ncbi:MAG: LamG-like jellyroll fold domain-containing protein [Saprospiraceae bacterium]
MKNINLFGSPGRSRLFFRRPAGLSFFLWLFLSVVVGGVLSAQTYTTCNQTIYDTGGAGGDYGSDENYQVHYCPTSSDVTLKITFSSISVEDGWDFLDIHDGADATAPLIAHLTGNHSNVSYSSSTPGGCLTLRFQSDNSFNQAGWVGQVSCVAPETAGNSSLKFDGANDWVTLGNPSGFELTSGTIECWVKPVGGGNANQVIFDKANAFSILMINGDVGCYDQTTDNLVLSGVNIANNEWHHLAYTFAPGTNNAKLYIDGELKVTYTMSAPNLTNALTLGVSNPAQAMNASVDEFRVWNTVRTLAEIQSNAECEIAATTSGLVALYRFNQSSGTTLDDLTANNYDGTLNNFGLTGGNSNWVATTPIPNGTACGASSDRAALAFDGNDDFVGIASTLPQVSATMTLEAWVNPASGYGTFNDPDNPAEIISRWGAAGAGNAAYRLAISSLGYVVFSVFNGSSGSSVVSTSTIPAATWTHIAATRASNNTLSIYINGVLSGTLSGAVVPQTSNYGVNLGKPLVGPNFYKGSMDEVRFWNTTRTETEIQDAKDCELDGDETGLIGYYDFNETLGSSSLANAVSGGPNGTLNNFALLGTTSNWVASGGVTSGTSCSGASAEIGISGLTEACGSTTLTAVGGTAYTWSTNATTDEITVTASGTYTVTATLSGGGTATTEVVVTILTPPAAPTFSGTATACDQVTLTAAGGTSYAWSNGESTAAATFTASGTYTVTATDANGCTASASQAITVNKATASISGDADGCDEVELTASGGTLFVWTGGATGANATFDAAGNYLVTVTDANGCTGTANHTIFNVAQSKTYYLDSDGDGYGDSDNPVAACTPLAGYILLGLDCDDTDADINPGATENCDNIDNNCNGILIEENCPGSNAPVADECATRSTTLVLTGKVFFNYGSFTNARNTVNKSSSTIGQPCVGMVLADDINVGFGFWTRFLLAPSAPTVVATQGDLPDRVQINWSADPLSPAAATYKIYRDNALLATVDNETFAFIDFNVLAGQFYTYEIAGVNQFGEGIRGGSLGFLNPNGVVTGQVKSFSGNPVIGTTVKLSPTLGAAVEFNGLSTIFAEYSPTFPRDKFTLSCWAKIGDGNPTTENTGIFDLGSDRGKNWWLHAVTPADGSKGVKFGIGKNPATKTEIAHTLPEATKNDWHHFAATYNGSSLLFYVDGELVETAVGEIEADSTVLFIGKRSDEGGYFTGKIDELRFYDRQLAQTEIQMTMNQTVSPNADGLTSYWKYDEGTGSKGFDLTLNKVKTFLCGATWTTDKPNVVNAGISDATGFYKIEGVNYGAGTTFTAVPSKDFHFNQSLEFNGANESYATLTNFDLPDSSTIEITVKNFDFSANQVILSKEGHFELGLNAGNLFLKMGGSTQILGTLGMGFHRLTFVLEQTGGSVAVDFYQNGALVGSHDFTGVAPDFSGGTAWTLGRNAAGNYFTGLIDEVAFYNTLLSLPDIQAAANIGTNVTHANLSSYFNLNEGDRTSLRDMGNALTGEGTTQGATWSTVAKISETLPHEFTPSSRLVTLNPSNTSADGIDFTDQSTIPVSGYVRFENTNCFQKGVEILVNGESRVPAVKTDAEGKFVVDLEPGETVRLTPKFEQHTFYPAFWDLTSVSAPVAGILFRNQTKRKVFGQMAGNLTCRKSVVPAGAIVKVKVATLNGCYEQIKELPTNGKFVFEGVPPDSVTVAVTEHSNAVIYNYFQNLGGKTLDLKLANDTTDFIYIAPPQVEMTALDTNLCGNPMLIEKSSYKTTVKVFEEYDGGRCYLDTALLTVNNEIAYLDQFDTLMTGGVYVHRFTPRVPNIAAPYLKPVQVTAKVNNQQATHTLQAVVLGIRPRSSSFVSASPEFPDLILRDPPGDGSSATIEEGTTICKTVAATAFDQYDNDKHITAHLGPDIETEQGTPFFATSLQIDVTADLGYTNTYLTSKSKTNEMTRCITTTRTISTSDNDLVVGGDMGGDVYLGGAMNYLYSITDELKFDTANCAYFLDKTITVTPEGYATTFVYSEYFILHNVVPDLLMLQTNKDSVSAQRWLDIVAQNADMKKKAVFSKNLSFDAGVVYSESEATETEDVYTRSYTQEFSNQFAAEFGVTVNGLGVSGGLAFTWTESKSQDTTDTKVTTRTVSYTLADDDIGDNFSVNVKKDKVFGTPVFDVVGGQSQCPWEPKTQPREGVNMTADKYTAVNVPMNDKAVFKIFIGNTSESEDTKVYTIEPVPEANPDGAIIRINGLPMTSVGVPFGETVEVTMTVERGPVAFDYQNLAVAVYSDCELERADALGIDPVAPFYDEKNFNVTFLEPCSEVNVDFPLDGWVHTVGAGPNMLITLGGYNINDADLELIRVQYRRTQGDGAWINIAEVMKADLDPVFEIVTWETATLQDGFYEIRAVAQCFGGLNPGISRVVQGKFEREPPAIFGTPEPADGVLSAGDEISIRFNEDIRCDQLIQADVFSNNNVGLYNTRTGDLVDAVVTCSGDKIVIVPNVPNQFLENEILRVEVDDIKDLANNNFAHAQWEFVVDRNNLNWVDNVPVYVSKYEEDIKSETRRLENRGGFNQAYEITGIPSWVRVFPKSGTLAPGQVQVITFEFDSTLVFGNYQDTVVLEGALGDEPLAVQCRVVCKDPNWQVNAADWDYSMNFVVQLDIEGTVSEDIEDIVGAFVGGELRGTAKLRPVNLPGPTVKYEAFLTVYSNGFSGEAVEFRIWDASECLLYGEVLEAFTFEADGLEGSPQSPVVLHTNSQVLREIVLHPGWNWVSFNLAFPDASVSAALSSVNDPSGDLLKSQTQFTQNTVGLGWLGSLTGLGNTSMYQYRTADADTIDHVGALIDPTTVNIPVSAGWNWIGYLPQRPLTVGEALASLTAFNGDLIKSQTEFAQYVAGFGWIGNLTYMSPPNGYLLKLSQAGTLTYPSTGNRPLAVDGATQNSKPKTQNSAWTVNPAQFEHSQTLIGMLASDGANVTGANFELGAFVNGECRGAATALWVEPLGVHLFFLTMYANTAGEPLVFKYHDGTSVRDLSETLFFSADASVGTVQEPFRFTVGVSSDEEPETDVVEPYLGVEPNPVRDGYATVRFRVPASGALRFTLTDAAGREVQQFDYQAQRGMNALMWEGAGRLPQGVYLLKTALPDGTLLAEKVVVK